MFNFARSFNQSLNKWNVSNVRLRSKDQWVTRVGREASYERGSETPVSIKTAAFSPYDGDLGTFAWLLVSYMPLATACSVVRTCENCAHRSN